MENFETIPPTGFYYSTTDLLKKNRKAITFYKKIYPKQYVPVTVKKSLLPAWAPSHFDKMFVLGFSEGRVWGKNGSVISQDNHLLFDQSNEWFTNQPNNHSIFSVEKLPALSYFNGTAAVLTHVGSDNYYHWMFEVLPRIGLLNKSGIEIDKLIVSDMTKRFQQETLKALGIPGENIITCKQDTHVKVRNLVVTSVLRYPNYAACQFLRDALLTEQQKKRRGQRRIYVKRKWTREIVNEHEINDVLSKQGFEFFELETMSVAEQIELFSDAEIVVGSHGAGFTNLVFCPPDTKVLELFPSNYVQPHYMLISAFSNLNYHFLIGEPMKNPYFLDQEWEGFDNLSIPRDRFENALRELC
jgi:hypothetical protein